MTSEANLHAMLDEADVPRKGPFEPLSVGDRLALLLTKHKSLQDAYRLSQANVGGGDTAIRALQYEGDHLALECEALNSALDSLRNEVKGLYESCDEHVRIRNEQVELIETVWAKIMERRAYAAHRSEDNEDTYFNFNYWRGVREGLFSIQLLVSRYKDGKRATQ